MDTFQQDRTILKKRFISNCLQFSGCIRYKGAKVQLLDLPGIIEGAKDGKGRGRQVIAVARTASLIFIGKLFKFLITSGP